MPKSLPLLPSLLVAASAALVSAYDNGAPHSALPPLGWSSWVSLGPGDAHPIFDFCDEQSVVAAADAFVSSGLFAAGYRHFHLDDCWAGGRNETGHVYPEKDHFPNGMKTVVDHVHSLGMVFGLYTCGGTKTCVGGRPGSKDHWTQDADVYAEWGVDWVKMDWCNSKPQDPKKTYPIMGKALNTSGRAIHFNMCEWGQENPWEWGDTCAQSWRQGGDHTGTWDSTKSVVRTSASIPAQYSGRPYGWNDMDMLETGNYAQAAHANGREGTMTSTEYKTEFSMWAIAASPLVVTTPIMNCSSVVPSNGSSPAKCNVSLETKDSQAKCTEGESFGCDDGANTMWTKDGCRGTFTCNGVSGVSCDVMGDGTHTCVCGKPGPVKCVPALTDLQKEILLNEEVIAVNQDVTPQGRPIKDGDLTVWARFLSNGSVAVALYNEEDSAASIGLNFDDLAKISPAPVPSASSWTSTTAAKVRDLWAHKDMGTMTGKVAPLTVAPHETVMLLLTKN